MGKTPNNYIYFNCSSYDKNNQNSTNCETWRIIGIVDGKIKIVKDDSIGNYSWDYDSSVENYQYYNEWSRATLKTFLNGDYYNNTITSATKTLNLISPSTWYLGGNNTPEVTAEEAYAFERGNKVYTCNEGNTEYYCAERSIKIENTAVGLMYPSDYGFASSACREGSKTLYDYDDSSCKTSNWLFKDSNAVYEWLLSPDSGDGYGGVIDAFYLYSDGFVYTDNEVDFASGVRPSIYLDSNIELVGSGTSGEPYKIIK